MSSGMTMSVQAKGVRVGDLLTWRGERYLVAGNRVEQGIARLEMFGVPIPLHLPANRTMDIDRPSTGQTY
jgi:hypothetical protein